MLIYANVMLVYAKFKQVKIFIFKEVL